jgi:hypothetical protein
MISVGQHVLVVGTTGIVENIIGCFAEVRLSSGRILREWTACLKPLPAPELVAPDEDTLDERSGATD